MLEDLGIALALASYGVAGLQCDYLEVDLRPSSGEEPGSGEA